jgi:hypothetical protein
LVRKCYQMMHTFGLDLWQEEAFLWSWIILY